MNRKFTSLAHAHPAREPQPGATVNATQEPTQSPSALDRIKIILKNTDPAKWTKAGSQLNSETLYPKALEYWEQVFTLGIPNGLLVLRSSTPVESKFVRGGYHVTPRAAERFTIELRAESWHPRELIDPYYRSTQKGVSKFETLAEGHYVRELFMDIQRRFHDHTHSRQETLGTKAAALIADFSEGRRQVVASEWTQTVSESGRSAFQMTADGVTLEITKVTNEGLDSFHALFTQESLQFRIDSTRLVKELFLGVEEKSRQSQLEALSKLLEPIS